MKSIRVLIADDHALVRAGIRALVERIKGVVVVAEAGKGSEALKLIARRSGRVSSEERCQRRARTGDSNGDEG